MQARTARSCAPSWGEIEPQDTTSDYIDTDYRTSYRDLLSTAETIIDMELRMQTVESALARVGHHCNSRHIDRICRNRAKSQAHARGRDVERYTFASQLSVLRSCPVVIARLMKGDNESDLLVIAKVLVISRLLHKALSSQMKNSKPPIVDHLRDKLGSLRSKLLRKIDGRLACAPSGSTDMLVESMSAYSLATSSTPTDVLRHFHHVRLEEIGGMLKRGEGLKEHGRRAMQLCLQTVQDTQGIFPRRLAEALAKLKAQPLVQDPDVRALYELNLDIHERWIGDEARDYTPQPRHNELQRPEAEKLLHQWSKQAISAFLKGIKTSLGNAKDLKDVAELRQELVETWILSGSRMAGVKSKNVLDDLRDTMNGQMENIVRSRAAGLKSLVEVMVATLGAWKDTGNALSLWTTTTAATDLSNGAQAFKSGILNTHQGRDEAVITVVSTFDKCMESVLEVKGIVKSMKETRWDDPFSDDVDIDDSDDEFGDSKQTLLSDDDPRLLEEATRDALTDALLSLGRSFAKIVGELTQGEEGGKKVSKAVLVLRVIREISDRIPRLRLQDRATPPPTPFTKDILEPLHNTLAKRVVGPAVSGYQKSLTAASKSKSKSHILWEGIPALPAQPSPSAFRFLQGLVKSMGSYGSDVWAPDGVQTLKGLANDKMTIVWKDAVAAIKQTPTDTIEPTTTEPEEEGEDVKEVDKSSESEEKTDGALTADKLKDGKQKQLLFDILYLQRYLSTTANPTAGSDSLVEALSKEAEVDEALKARLTKNAGDYARKTYLLFALLS